MTAPAIHILLELERPTTACLLSFHLADEVRLLSQLDALGIERLRREVLASLDEALLVLRRRTSAATAADIFGEKAA